MAHTAEVSRKDLDKQLDEALEETFPASDPIAVGDITTATPDRPLHRKPAAIDQALVERLAREVADSHEAADKTGAA